MWPLVRFVLIALVLLVGCAQPGTRAVGVTRVPKAAMATPTPKKPATPLPRGPAPTQWAGAPAREPATSYPVPAELSAAAEVARMDLANWLGLSLDDVVVTGINAFDWPDASLGCPEPGKTYAQSVTPGYEIVLTVNLPTYAYNYDFGYKTDQAGSRVVVCDNPVPPVATGIASLPPPLWSPIAGYPPTASPRPMPTLMTRDAPLMTKDEMLAKARSDLASKLGVPLDRISVLSAEPTEWPDSGIGCPQPGQEAMTGIAVIVPGYQIRLGVDGKVYEFHSDEGRQVLYCPNPGQPAALGPPIPGYMIAERVQADLGPQLGLSRQQVAIVLVRSVVWKDYALGCRMEPNMHYTQVEVPGYLIQLRAGGRDYEFHASLRGNVGACQSPEPPVGTPGPVLPTPTPLPPAAPIVEKARGELAGKLGVGPDQVVVLTVLPVTWSDAQLGCEQPDVVSDRVRMPGLLIVLKAGGQSYEYHADYRGTVVTCDRPERPIDNWPNIWPTPVVTPASPGGTPSPETVAVEKARDAYALMMNVLPEQVTVVSVQRVEWPDQFLGCQSNASTPTGKERPTPGYVIVVRALGMEMEYHADAEGKTVTTCLK